MEIKEQCYIDICRSSAALKNSDDFGGYKRVCENVTENIQISV
jgi:hypothetical protein